MKILKECFATHDYVRIPTPIDSLVDKSILVETFEVSMVMITFHRFNKINGYLLYLIMITVTKLANRPVRYVLLSYCVHDAANFSLSDKYIIL
jgi:hypothetical protein